MDNVGILLVALLIGVALGAGGAWLVLRRAPGSPSEVASERMRAAEQTARADAERARADIAAAEVRVSQAVAQMQEARTETERAHRAVAEARAEASRAQAAAAAQQADAAAWEAKVVAANAARDVATARATEIAADRDALVKEFTVLSGRALEDQGRKADASAEQRLKATEQLMTPIKESLAAFNTRLSEVEKARVQMSTELAGQVRAVQFTGEQLRRETNALATALRKPQVRGSWGELQLKRVAEMAGMLEYCDFVQQETSATSEDRVIRPDLKVTLSEGKFIYVDSKVPLSAFLDAQETDNDAERDRLLGLFAKNVRTHVDQLSSKNYWKADPGTPEFVVLFIPNEALGFEALRLIPDLHEYANARDIIVATPTTLIALLRAIAYGWKQAKLATAAAEVSQLGRELYDRLGRMGHNVDRLGRALGSAVKAYNASVGSLETRVMVTARRFRDLNVTSADLAALTTVEEPLRQIAAPELVEDATAVPSAVGRTRRGELTPGGLPPEAETLGGGPAPQAGHPDDAFPEATDLHRGEPPLLDLIGDADGEAERGRGTMAG